MDQIAEIFETHRPLLFSIAYRMLGSVMEAEDAVQDAYLRFLAVDRDEVESPKAFLSTIVTRLCLDRLKSARMQREVYVGPWLPEPLLTESGPAQTVERNEMISIAFLTLLEALSPVERAVYLLRTVFDYPYPEIAQIVDKSEANCRQIFSRTQRQMRANRPRFEPPSQAHDALLGGFLQAINEGNEQSLTQMLTEDIQLWSDGGGKVTAARRPLFGREHVVRFLIGLGRTAPPGLSVEIAEVNASKSVLIRSGTRLISVMNFVISEGKIWEIHAVLNPDKLQHLQ